MKKKIAVTGGIGSGKSLVCKILKELNEECYSCDEIYRQLWQEESYQNELLAIFPEIEKNGKPDKGLLASLVFQNEEALQKLNAFAHPKIMSRLYSLMDSCTNALVFAEVPLLFEGGFEKDFNAVFVVLREKTQRIFFTAQRDNVSTIEVERRIENQFNYDSIDKTNSRYIFIENNGSIEELKENVRSILRKI